MEPIKITETEKEFAELSGFIKEVLDVNNARKRFNEKNAIFKITITKKTDNKIRDFKLFDDGDSILNNLVSIIKYLSCGAICILIIVITYAITNWLL